MNESRHSAPVVGRLHRPNARPTGRRGLCTLVTIRSGCDRCGRWVDDHLAALRKVSRGWGGDTLVQEVPGTCESCDGWLAVLDEWDQVFHLSEFGAEHSFPTIDAIAEWVRFVAIQCEECERPEDPWLP